MTARHEHEIVRVEGDRAYCECGADRPVPIRPPGTDLPLWEWEESAESDRYPDEGGENFQAARVLELIDEVRLLRDLIVNGSDDG